MRSASSARARGSAPTSRATPICSTRWRELRPLDLALLPVWGWGPNLGGGHLDPERAARALELLKPGVAVPIHWGTLYPIGLGRFRRYLLHEPPRAFARHARRHAPEVEVRIVEPGDSTRLAP